jgi:hypothetical protein
MEVTNMSIQMLGIYELTIELIKKHLFRKIMIPNKYQR